MDDLIFGYTWEEIHAAQQGALLGKTISHRCVYDHPCEKNDVDLLIIHQCKTREEAERNLSLLMGELDIKSIKHKANISPFKKRIEHEYYFLVKNGFYLRFMVFEEDGKEDIHQEWHFYREVIDTYEFPLKFILHGQGRFDVAIKTISEYFGIPYKNVFLEDLLDKYGRERGPMI